MSCSFNMKHKAGTKKCPMKVMAGTNMQISCALVTEAAESASGCERDSRLGYRAVRHQVDDTPVLHRQTAPEFCYLERIVRLVKPPSEAEYLSVCEIGRRVLAQASRPSSLALTSNPRSKSCRRLSVASS